MPVVILSIAGFRAWKWLSFSCYAIEQEHALHTAAVDEEMRVNHRKKRTGLVSQGNHRFTQIGCPGTSVSAGTVLCFAKVHNRNQVLCAQRAPH